MKKFRFLNDESGFTLIELMVTITILIIIVGVAVPRLTALTDKAKDTAIMNFSGTVKNGMEMYNVVNGHYPKMDSWSDGSLEPLKDNLDLVADDANMEKYNMKDITYESNGEEAEEYKIIFTGESENDYFLNENGFYEEDPDN